jgi:hypothetical protein
MEVSSDRLWDAGVAKSVTPHVNAMPWPFLRWLPMLMRFAIQGLANQTP